MNETPPPEFIYHLVLKLDFLQQIRGTFYTPSRLSEDKFIHCTDGEDLTVLVANDYFSKAVELLVLKIRLNKVMAKVVFEKPLPIAGGGKSHLREGHLFPHIYGSLNLDAIEGIAKLPKINYIFHFPKEFYSYLQFIEGRV